MCARCAWGAPEGGGTDPGPADRCQVHCVDELRNSRFENNKTLLRELREDLRADAGGLWEATRKDAIQDGGPAAEGVRRQGLLRCLGAWARACVHVSCLQADRLLLNPRFDVEQIKPNWANRLRPIDLRLGRHGPRARNHSLQRLCHERRAGMGAIHVSGGGAASMGAHRFTNRCTLTCWTTGYGLRAVQA